MEGIDGVKAHICVVLSKWKITFVRALPSSSNSSDGMDCQGQWTWPAPVERLFDQYAKGARKTNNPRSRKRRRRRRSSTGQGNDATV